MKRTRTRTVHKGPVSAILIADIHLSDTVPAARTDDYFEAQVRKLRFILNLQKEHGGVPVLCSGDVFHHWKSSPWLLGVAFSYLPEGMITIPGNHDLPEHSMEQYKRSSLHLLELVTPDLVVLKQNPAEFQIGHRRVCILHELIWPETHRHLQNVAGGRTAQEVLEDHADVDLVLTGDNHLPFVETNGKQLLVNPGSIMRRTADQIDHRPKCYLYYAESNTAKPVYLPIEAGVINRDHIEKVKERDDRITAYIDRMRMTWEVGLSFRQNLEAFFEENKTSRKVVELIWEHVPPAS